ncbi:MAG TPA: MFS transporter, partial [Pseudolysinimonas sp.]|nr:MFS transporter [Pseudolysinimonas sp.]
GPLARFIGFRTQVASAAALVAGSTALIGLFHAEPWQLALEAGIFGLGMGLGYAAITSVVVQSVPPTQTGIASGMNTNLRTIGSSIGVSVMTAIITSTAGADGLPSEAGYSTGFLTIATIGAGAVVVAIVGGLIGRRAIRADSERIETTAESPFGGSEVELEPEAA